MPQPPKKIIADCSHLPFSRGHAERLRAAAPSPIEKIPFDASRWWNLKLRRLAGLPVLDRPPALPDFDPLGVACGAGYRPRTKATKSRFGNAGNYAVRKSSFFAPNHSGLENRILMYAEMCPFVVDIRTQYDIWDSERWGTQYGKHIPNSQKKALDFLLTLDIPGQPDFIYHCIFVKREADLVKPEVVTRLNTEVQWLRPLFISLEVMTEHSVPDIEYRNLKYFNALTRKFDSLEPLIPDAKKFASRLLKSHAKGSVERVVGMVGRRCGYTFSEAVILFGVAIYIGVLEWDHRYVFGRRERFVWVKPTDVGRTGRDD